MLYVNESVTKEIRFIHFFFVNIMLIIKTITDNTTNYKSIISPWTN